MTITIEKFRLLGTLTRRTYEVLPTGGVIDSYTKGKTLRVNILATLITFSLLSSPFPYINVSTGSIMILTFYIILAAFWL